MKYKILLIMIFILISLNIVTATTYTNGTLIVSGYAEQEYENIGFQTNENLDLSQHMKLHYKGLDDSGLPISIEYDDVRFLYNGDYADVPQNLGGPVMIYDGGLSGTLVGTGNVWIYKTADHGGEVMEAKITYLFDDGFIPGNDKFYDMYVYTHAIRTYVDWIGYENHGTDTHPPEYGTLNIAIEPLDSTYTYSHGNSYNNVDVTYKRISNFKNTYSIGILESTSTIDIDRIYPGYEVSSKLVIRNQDTSLYYETGFSSINTTLIEIFNETQKYYIEPEASAVEHLIYEYIPPVEPENVTPTLTTDKLLYNTSEQITISFTNIDEIEGYVGERLSLYILYPIIDDYKDYDTKYMLHLLGDRRDETFTLNTSFLTPQNEYHLGVCIDGDFHNIDDSLIISDTFYVYDENEYLSTSCNPEGNCYTYNNDVITIYYKINNNSNIIIKDNNDNIIQTYYNIIDEGSINYHIPIDENKLNTYPNWKVYLNNTEYETNYSTDVTVYWSLIATPTPTPIYTSVPIDENVSVEVDRLKEESKPIFDLIYGLSELVVDNPDYDDDNIITENEMNNWFNSLIPIVLILLIFIVYTGLSKRR